MGTHCSLSQSISKYFFSVYLQRFKLDDALSLLKVYYSYVHSISLFLKTLVTARITTRKKIAVVSCHHWLIQTLITTIKTNNYSSQKIVLPFLRSQTNLNLERLYMSNKNSIHHLKWGRMFLFNHEISKIVIIDWHIHSRLREFFRLMQYLLLIILN